MRIFQWIFYRVSSNFRNINIMAFVYRSEKSSPFQSRSIQQSPQARKSEAHQLERRIHHQDPASGKLSSHKKNIKPQRLKTAKLEPSIPSKEKIFNPISQLVKKNQHINFRSLKKKSKLQSHSYKTLDEKCILKDNKQYYDLPGSLSHKTLVKYMKKTPKPSQEKTPTESPGPGSYDPQKKVSTRCPIFREATSFDPQYLRNKDIQSIQHEPEQNLFAVKYNYMNSSVFKKSLNLRKISNNILLNKLLSPPKNDSNKENNVPDQFIKIKECQPGPGSYNETNKLKNAPTFGNAERFKQKVATEGLHKFYDITEEDKDNNQTSCFCSEAKRFSDDKIINTPLQYANYENSLIKDSQNRKDAGFKLDLGRVGQKSIDERPYYQLQPKQKREFMTKFYKYESKRQLFHIKSQASPGPEDYDTCLSWRKEHSCLIKSDIQKQKVSSLPGSEPCMVNFYLCSQKNLYKKSQNAPKGVLKSSKLSMSPTPVPEQPSPQKYYDTSPSWQIKSFNQRFINDILPTNNPIKNKIL